MAKSWSVSLAVAMCATATVAALWLGLDLTRFLLAEQNKRLINPAGEGKLVALSALWVLMAAVLAVAAAKIHAARLVRRAMVGSWSIVSICLWSSLSAFVYIVYYPLPPENSHVDKLLLMGMTMTAWAFLAAFRPNWLDRFLHGGLYKGIRLVVLNAVVFVMVAELVLRLADPLLGRHGPFGHALTPAHMKPFAPTSGSIARTNSLGFRDRERSLQRSASGPRVIALGDSFTYGAWGPYDDMFVTLLENRLQEQFPGGEVINLGVPGWEPAQEFHLLKVYGIRLTPDVVMLNFFVQNDIMFKRSYDMQDALLVAGQSYYVHSNGNWFHDSIGPERWVLYHHVKYLIRVGGGRFTAGFGIHEFQHPNLRSSTFGSRDQYLAYIAERTEIYLVDDTPMFRFHWDRTRRILGEIQEYVRGRGLKLLLVMIPAHEQVDQHVRQELLNFVGEGPGRYDFAKPQRLLRQWCEEQRVAYVDLLPVFESAQDAESLYFPNDIHWSVAGNLLAARTIYPILARGVESLRN